MFPQTFLGIDILDMSCPRYVLLKRAGEKLKLFNCGEIKDLPNELKSLKSRAQKIAIALPKNKLMIRHFQIPVRPAEDIEKNMIYEIEKKMPFPLKDIYYEYAVIEQKKGMARVFFVGITREQLKSYEFFLKDNKILLSNVILDISCAANYNAFVFNHKAELAYKTFYLIDIGKNKVEISVIEDGLLVLNKSFKLGADALVRYIVEFLKIDLEFAEQIVFAPSEIKEEKLKLIYNQEGMQKAISTWSQKILKEMELSFKFYMAKSDSRNIHKIFINLYGLEITNIINQIKAKFNIPVELIDPFAQIEFDKSSRIPLEGLQQKKDMLLPMGLALRAAGESTLNIDFSNHVEKQMEFNLKQKIILGVLTVFILGMISITSFIFMKNKIYENEVQQLIKKINEVNKVVGNVKSLSKKIENIARDSQTGQSVMSYMKDILSVILPNQKDFYLTDFTFIAKKGINLIGRALNHKVVMDMLATLKQNAKFKDVKLVRSVAKRNGSQKWVEFELSCSFVR